MFILIAVGNTQKDAGCLCGPISRKDNSTELD